MKLRLKFTDCRPNCSLCLDDEKVQNYGQLRGEITAVVNPGLSFELSLNYGKDLIRVDDEATLKELGLVSGDVLTVVVHQDVSDMPQQLLESKNIATAAEDTVGTKKQILRDRMHDKRLGETRSYMSKIMLCRESQPGKIPSTLEHLYLTQPVESKFDALILVIHRLMSEVGFVEAEVDHSVPLLSNWKAMNGIYKMQYYIPACPTCYCQLVCVALGENILGVHAVVCAGPSKDTIMNTSIHCDKYLHNLPNKKCEPKQVYRNLSNLSQCFKDSIAHPLSNVICMDAGIPTKSDFMSLPMEVKLIILNYLNGHCLVNLSEVCKELNQLCKEDMLWKKCLVREFPPYKWASENRTEPWRTLYIDVFKKDCNWKRIRQLSPPPINLYHSTYGPSRRRMGFDLTDQERIHLKERRRIIEGITPFALGFPRFI